jgi:hypothetical protein
MYGAIIRCASFVGTTATKTQVIDAPPLGTAQQTQVSINHTVLTWLDAQKTGLEMRLTAAVMYRESVKFSYSRSLQTPTRLVVPLYCM